jgi:hydroxymethylpyrimidine pyrophosphatase-like HAD family hydrolase
MDGTLIEEYSSATNEMRTTWNDLKNDGIIRAISTGQSEKEMDIRLLRNGLDLPEYSMNDQGTIIKDKLTNNIIKKNIVPTEPVKKIVEEITQNAVGDIM